MKKAKKVSKKSNKKVAKKSDNPKKKEPEALKYGVDDLAKIMDLKPATVRVLLRNGKVKKAGKSYGWNTQTEMDDLAKKLKPKTESKKPKKKAA